MDIDDILKNQQRKEQLDGQLGQIYDDGRERSVENLAYKKGMFYIDLRKVNIEVFAIALIEEKIAKENNIIAFQMKAKEVAVALVDDENEGAKKVIQELKEKGYIIKLFLCSKVSLEYAFQRYSLVSKPREIITDTLILSNTPKVDFRDLKETLVPIDQNNVSLYNGLIFKAAVLSGASDIHISPRDEDAAIKFRIDGVLDEITSIPKKMYFQLRDRIKLLARLKLNIQNSPQDGRFKIIDQGEEYQARTSAIPSQHGEILVMRILSQSAMTLSLEDLGFDEDEVKLVKGLITSPNGMVLVTGPTGSGKTTTLYSLLKEKAKPGVNAITIEDPIEYQLKGVNQTQVNDKQGYGFSSGLKSILRQDPDVIMVGEIRDKETANIAIQASLTGHLVFSTLHTNEAAGAIARLMEFDIENDIMASSLKIIIAQRLVRKLCPYCKEEYSVPEETEKEIKNALSVLSPKSNIVAPREIKKLYRPKGCAKCNNLGYKGQVGIFELLFVNDDINEMIKARASISEIRERAIQMGMTPLFHDGLSKVIKGETSMEELVRVSGDIDYINLMFDKLLSQSLLRGIKVTKDEYDNVFGSINNLKKIEKIINEHKAEDAFEMLCILGLIYKASDIHVEPEENIAKVRYRIDGVLQEKIQLDMASYMGIIQYTKQLIGVDYKEKGVVNEGRFKIERPEQDQDIRVSIIPSGFGESLVMRFLSANITQLELTDLGIYPEMMPSVKKMMRKPNGIILACGPTSSGKTTTMYAMLTTLNNPNVKIMTVEDPIEYQIKGITQTQVNESKGYTFSAALKSFLRQNPNIILVGEIRDEETAKTAVQASLTGHLILSTIHTIDTSTVISRLKNFNIAGQDLSASFSGAVAQRLVRKLCPYCKEKKELKPEEESFIKETIKGISKEMNKLYEFRLSKEWKMYDKKGCDKCKFTGFEGQVGLFEILYSDTEIEELIASQADANVFKKELLERSLSLTQDGVLKVIEGVTTIEEIKRVI